MSGIESMWPGGGSSQVRRVRVYKRFAVKDRPDLRHLSRMTAEHFNLPRKKKPSPDQIASFWRHQCTNYDQCDRSSSILRREADEAFLALYGDRMPYGFHPTSHWD